MGRRENRIVRSSASEGGATFVHDGAPGANVLTKAGLNADDERARRVNELLIAANFRFLDTAVRSLRTAMLDQLDVGGRGICFRGERTGTRSQTIVAVSGEGWTRNRLSYAEGFPCTAQFEDLSDRFR